MHNCGHVENYNLSNVGFYNALKLIKERKKMGLDISEKHAPIIKNKKRQRPLDEGSEKQEKKDKVEVEKDDNKKEENPEEESESDSEMIFTEDSDEGAGRTGFHSSYSGMQQIRKELIEMTISYLEANPTFNSASCIGRLKTWLISPAAKTDESNPLRDFFEGIMSIDYKNVFYDYNHIEDLRANDISGIVKFVNHSDSDGFLSEGDVLDILRLLEKLEPYKGDSYWFDELFNFSKDCVQRHRGMYFH